MNRNEQMILTGRQEQIQDLDTLPRWDRSLIDYRKYHQYVGQSGIRYEMTMQATRGCPYRCFYCDVQNLTPMHRRRSVESVFDEVKYLHDMGVRKSEFIDDAFNVNVNAFKSFFRKVIASGMEMLEAGRFPDTQMLQNIKGVAFRSDGQIHLKVVVLNGKKVTYACYPLWVRAGTEKAGSK